MNQSEKLRELLMVTNLIKMLIRMSRDSDPLQNVHAYKPKSPHQHVHAYVTHLHEVKVVWSTAVGTVRMLNCNHDVLKCVTYDQILCMVNDDLGIRAGNTYFVDLALIHGWCLLEASIIRSLQIT